MKVFARNYIGIICCFLALTSSCKPADPFSYTAISEARILGPVEQDISFSAPIVPVKQVNKLCFAYSDDTRIIKVDAPPRFTDGSELRIVATLFDNMDNRFELTNLSENAQNYLCLAPENYGAWLEISRDKPQFTKIIVRANQPVHVTRIEWKAYNAWDFK